MSRVGRRPPRRSFLAGEDGAALVEFALVVPLLVMILLAIIQIGVALEHSLGFRAPTAEDALEVETVGDLVELVRAQVAGR
jgi:Flp pilus assembly protein TadG